MRWSKEIRKMYPDEYEEDYEDIMMEFMEMGERTFVHPDIPDFSPPVYKHAKAEVSLKDRPLQVIVKIASLEVEPGQALEVGMWHVDGTLDEHIVATACCHVDCENVQGGERHFRTAVHEPDYEQNDSMGVFKGYSLDDDSFLLQPCGASSVPTGRVLRYGQIRSSIASVKCVLIIKRNQVVVPLSASFWWIRCCVTVPLLLCRLNKKSGFVKKSTRSFILSFPKKSFLIFAATCLE
jgi:hypothetical protein